MPIVSQVAINTPLNSLPPTIITSLGRPLGMKKCKNANLAIMPESIWDAKAKLAWPICPVTLLRQMNAERMARVVSIK